MKEMLRDEELNSVSGGTGEAVFSNSKMIGGPLLSEQEKNKMTEFSVAWQAVYGGVGGMNPGPHAKEAMFEKWKRGNYTPDAEMFIRANTVKPVI